MHGKTALYIYCRQVKTMMKIFAPWNDLALALPSGVVHLATSAKNVQIEL
jgi:hypothetical protein